MMKYEGLVRTVTVCSTILLLILSYATGSYATETLTLRQALILGLENNFELRISNLNLFAAEAGVAAEESRFDVQTEATFGLVDTKTPVAFNGSPEQTLESRTLQGELALAKRFSFGTSARLGVRAEQNDADLYADRLDPAYRAALVLDLTQPLLQDLGPGVNAANLKIAEKRQGQRALSYLNTAQLLVQSIEETYLDLSVADAIREYRSQSRELASELLDANQRKLDAGLIPVSEVNQANTALAGREEAYIVAQQLYEIALNRLRDLIENDQAVDRLSDNQQLDPLNVLDLDLPQHDSALAVAFQSRPDINQARLELDASKIQLVFAKNKQLPRLDLQASLSVNGLSGDDSTGVWQGGRSDAFQSALDGDGTEWSVGLQFKYPLGNRAARAQKRAAEAGLSQALYNYRRHETAAETEIKNALVIIGRGQERLDVSDRFVALAETTLEQENRRLQEGLSDSFRLLSFQDALIEAKIRRVTAIADYRKGVALLYRAMGQNLEQYDITAALPPQGAK